MTPASRQGALAYFAAALILLVAGTFGFWDVLWNGNGLSTRFALATGMLWLVAATPIAAAGALAAHGLERLLASRAAHASYRETAWIAVCLVIVEGAVLLGAVGGLLGLPFALGLCVIGALGVCVVAERGKALRRIARHAPLGIAALLIVTALTPLLRIALPRTLIATLGLACLAASLRLGKPSRRVLSRLQAAVALSMAFAIIALGLDGRSSMSAPPAPSANASAQQRPHVVLVVLDTQRADYIGAYGHPGGLTPGLDRLAEAGTLYEACFAAANWTVPSHASLFTGLYPQTHGASFEHHRHLDDRFETLAEGLAANGYATAAFVANEYVTLANLDQGFEHYEQIGEGFENLALRRALLLLGFPSRFSDHGVLDGVDRVARHLAARSQTDARPLFLFVNLLEPHWRHFPPLADRIDQLGLAGTLRATRTSARFYGPTAMAKGEDDASLRASITGLYAAAVQHQDRQFARLLDVIDAALPKEDTLLIVTNDHGENLGEAGRWDHVFAVNDHLVRAPLIVRNPRFPAGARISGLCSHVDVPATVADLVDGYEPADAPDARSLVPDHFSARGQVFAAGDPYLGHFERMGNAAGFAVDAARWNRALRSARDAGFKYVESDREPGRLYDLSADPDEALDVGDANPARREALRKALRDWLARTPVYAPPAEGAVPADAGAAQGLDEEAIERLRSLGYAE